MLHSQSRPKSSISSADLVVLLMGIASPREPAEGLICEMLQSLQSEVVNQVCINRCFS